MNEVASGAVGTTLLDAVRAWRDEDPDPATRAELDALVEAGDTDALTDRFGQRLQFGTAGLRGAMGAGPNRMNVATVRYAAAGLARFLLVSGAGPAEPAVVIGCDARHRSEDFALESARVLAAAGVRALLLPPRLPTPVLAFAVRHLHADAGVMVTASHNPAADNGYKVYAADGAQIVPPVDQHIAEAIAGFASLDDVPVAELDDPFVERLGDDVLDAYRAGAIGVVAPGPRTATVVYTPMHGVGGRVFLDLADRAGFAPPVVVTEQFEPDPDFPTVAFPNPEEPGALDLALAAAGAAGADVVIANDPDADRLGVAVPTDQGWRRLTGDELGGLLADHLLRRPPPDDRQPLLTTTVVSSRLLRAIAEDAGAAYAETLTGFKWLVRPALAHPELRPVLAYEEALGYAIGELVRDKDGLTAGLVVLEIAARARDEGRTVADLVDDLARRHGLHATTQWSLRDPEPGGLARLAAAVAAVRAEPPAALGPARVTTVRDLLVDHDAPERSVGGPLAPTDALVLGLDDGCRVVVRPSGTEPKLKVYLEVVAPVPGGDVASARAAASARLDVLLDAVRRLLEPRP